MTDTRRHLLLPQDASQEEAADGHAEDPRDLPREPVERTPQEDGQVVTDLAQRPVTAPLVAFCLQFAYIGGHLVKITELDFATCWYHLTGTACACRCQRK